MSVSKSDSLNWLAVRYVLGELPAAECDAFEERLTHDLIACEAVTEATRLVLTARAALAETSSEAIPESTIRMQPATVIAPRGSWIAFAGAITAACLLWGLFSLQVQEPTGPGTNSAAELVSLWRSGVPTSEAESDDADAELMDAAVDIAATNASNRDREGSGSDAHHIAGQSLAVGAHSDSVPRWMLAAVSIESEGTFDGPAEKVQENGL